MQAIATGASAERRTDSARLSAHKLGLRSDPERLAAFAAELDAVKAEVEAQIGDQDVRYVERMDAFSRTCEVAGRALIHFSFEPITFGAGVVLLWLHKQLQATEVGHTALHGAYDKLPQAERFHSQSFAWQVPIDEASWRHGHNARHHGNTNVAGKDPDIHFGPVRLTEHAAHRRESKWQLPFTLAFLFPNFGFLMNLHFTGVNDYWFGNGRSDKYDFIKDRSWATFKNVHWAALRKYIPYYLKEYVFFPLLAGPFFWKVMLGNWLAEVMRDVYSAATIYCGHVGEDTAAYPEGTKAHGRGEWYAMQVEASNDFEVPWAVSVLCGGLDRQIEHHLFSKLPPQRLRQIAPQVREICERYGVRYNTGSWPATLKKALAYVAKLSKASPSPMLAARNVIDAMA